MIEEEDQAVDTPVNSKEVYDKNVNVRPKELTTPDVCSRNCTVKTASELLQFFKDVLSGSQQMVLLRIEGRLRSLAVNET